MHSVSVQADDEDGPALFVIFNDQGNQRSDAEVRSITMDPDAVTIAFARGRGPWSGRVSLAREIEIFEVPDPEPVRLDLLRIVLAPAIDRSALREAMEVLMAIVPDADISCRVS